MWLSGLPVDITIMAPDEVHLVKSKKSSILYALYTESELSYKSNILRTTSYILYIL